MSRLDAEQMAHAIEEARRVDGAIDAYPPGRMILARAVLDLVEERDATAHDGEVRRGREALHAMTRDRDALAARLATYGQRGPGCSDHGSPYDEGEPR